MKRTKNILLVFALFLGLFAQAQQDAIYSQYLFNPFVLNPAYAGSRDVMSTTLLYRSQWVGMNGAPKTGTFSIHTPVKATNMAWGLNVMSDKIGPTSTIAVQGTYAYRLRFLGGKLALALRGGYFSTAYDKNTLDFNNNDEKDVGGVSRAGVLNFDFGAYYHTPTFFIGFVGSHLNAPSQEYDLAGVTADNGLTLDLERHIIASTGFVFNLNEDLKLKPSVYAKFMPRAPVNVDVNLSVLLKRRVWLGVSTSSDGSFTGMVEIYATDFLRVGYAYDMWMKPEINRMSSHEVFIGYDFRFSKKTTESPKYL